MPTGELDPAQDGATGNTLTRAEFLTLSSLAGIGLGADQATAPFRRGVKALGDGANLLINLADILDKRYAKLDAWLERFDGLPIEKGSFTVFPEKDGSGKTYQLGFTVRDPSLIPDNDRPYTQITLHGVTKDQAKGIAQVFGGTKLTAVGETNLFDRLVKIGGGAGLGVLAASVLGKNKLIVEVAAVGAGAAALLGTVGVATALALLPEEKRRELFDSLLRSINEKLQPIFNIFNGSTSNLQSNEPTPISQAVTATFTPRPSPSATVTFTPTATETETPTPTVTAKPSDTPTPTETPQPIFHWETSFDNGLTGFTGGLGRVSQGGVPGSNDVAQYALVSGDQDLVAIGRGLVYKAVITGVSPYDQAQRPYPDKYFNFQQGPYSTDFDLFVNSSASTSIDNGQDQWVSVYSSFDKASGNDWHAAVTINLRRKDGQVFLSAYTFGNGSKYDEDRSVPSQNLAFPFDKWVKVRVEVGADRIIRVYQDGHLVSSLTLDSNVLLGTAGGHWGAYTGKNVDDLVLYNDNIILNVFK